MSTMNSEIFKALSELEDEKKIKKDYMLEKISQALSAAYKKDHPSAAESVVVEIDDLRQQLSMFVNKTVAEDVYDDDIEVSLEEAREVSAKYNIGDVVKFEIKTKEFGRIAAQTAKQVIIQGIREAERNVVAEEFSAKEQEIVTAIVNKIDPRTGNISVQFAMGGEKRDLMLPRNEQIRGEQFTEGDHIKLYVAEIKKGMKGPMIVISRTHPGFVKRMFELEVPEIASGVVQINAISREAGSRTKIAVSSTDPNVGAVGACIGSKRSRINNIVKELNGEKIDIINYSETPKEFIASALAPAAVIDVTFSGEAKTCQVIVPAEQLSLAIGKEGQNARLAAKLTGYKIDIRAKQDDDLQNLAQAFEQAELTKTEGETQSETANTDEAQS